jgi:hypothetical protein
MCCDVMSTKTPGAGTTYVEFCSRGEQEIDEKQASPEHRHNARTLRRHPILGCADSTRICATDTAEMYFGKRSTTMCRVSCQRAQSLLRAPLLVFSRCPVPSQSAPILEPKVFLYPAVSKHAHEPDLRGRRAAMYSLCDLIFSPSW